MTGIKDIVQPPISDQALELEMFWKCPTIHFTLKGISLRHTQLEKSVKSYIWSS